MSQKRPHTHYYSELNTLPMISVHHHVFSMYRSHRHDFFEIEFVMEGEIDCNLNGMDFHLKKGDLVFVTPTAVHSYSGRENTSATTVTVHFNIEAIGNFSEMLLVNDCVVNCEKELEDAFSALLEESKKNDYLSDVALRNAFERVIILFMRSTRRFETQTLTDGIIAALAYIDRNYSEDITLEKISSICGYSTSYLCRLFKQETNLTPIQYLNKMRLESACRLLVSTDMSAIEICVECGFGSVRNFNREFKRRYGVTPIEYRKAEINNCL